MQKIASNKSLNHNIQGFFSQFFYSSTRGGICQIWLQVREESQIKKKESCNILTSGIFILVTLVHFSQKVYA
jgi:hypothetical protein